MLLLLLLQVQRPCSHLPAGLPGPQPPPPGLRILDLPVLLPLLLLFLQAN
jgi:hypothetical protein